MVRVHCLAGAILALVSISRCADSRIDTMPAPNGTYNVALTTTYLTDHSRLAPLAPTPTPRLIELSIFYPTTNTTTVPIPYFPAPLALALDIEHREGTNLSTPNGTLERLLLPLAPNLSPIATFNTPWPVLLFSPAFLTSRHLYSTLLTHLASMGYVIIAFDAPYDTDVFLAPNSTSTVIPGNSSDAAQTDATINADSEARTADFSFVIDHLPYLSTLIPACEGNCLNNTAVVAWGHSIGGAAATAAAASDKRVIGAVNFNGALWGDVIDTGFDVPYLLFMAAGQTSDSDIVRTTPFEAFNEVWGKVRADKWWLVLGESKHYTFSDLGLALEVLGVKWDEAVGAVEQITRLDGRRGLEVLVEVVGGFVGGLFGDVGGVGGVLEEELRERRWPEVSVDVRTSVGGGTVKPEEYVSAADGGWEGRVVVAKVVVGVVLVCFVWLQVV